MTLDNTAPQSSDRPLPARGSDEIWLVRTAQNLISGPYTQARVAQMIIKGEIGLQDEVCCAGKFWIYLYEREEIAAQLGVQVPFNVDQEDRTETDSGAARTKEISSIIQELQSTGGNGTTVIRTGSHSSSNSSGTSAPRPEKIEKLTLWRFTLLFLIATSIVFLFFVWRILTS